MRTPIEQLISRLVTLRDEAEGFSAEVEAYQRAINEAESLLKHEQKGWENNECDATEIDIY